MFVSDLSSCVLDKDLVGSVSSTGRVEGTGVQVVRPGTGGGLPSVDLSTSVATQTVPFKTLYYCHSQTGPVVSSPDS